MTKTDKLNKLFDKWVKEIPEYAGKFIKDGIISESLYNEARKKILFIMKEPDDPEQTEWTFQDLWEDGVRHRFSFRLADWAYGIFHDFPDYNKVTSIKENRDNAIKSIALINIKKTGGTNSSDKEEIFNHCERNHKFILKEIEIIDPEIIILGTGSWKIRESMFKNVEWEELKEFKHDILLGKWGQTLIVDFIHPSARFKSVYMYDLLRHVFSSKEFQYL